MDDRLQGIEAPGLDGRGLTAVRYSAFADDLMLYARSYTELSVIRELMDTFEQKLASGAQRNWGARLPAASTASPPPRRHCAP